MPPKSRAKGKATANAGPTQAQLKNLYVEGAELILRYLNGDIPTNSYYEKLLAKQKYKTVQGAARNWCWNYSPEKAHYKKTIAKFQKKVCRFPTAIQSPC